jgi:tRNA pseudouridine38-40 synthase
MRYAILIEYNGTCYKGWQKQDNQNTIQGQIEQVLSKFANHSIEIHAAGRTDAGVHALGQVATFDSDANRNIEGWKIASNSMLPLDIRIKDIKIVDPQFHARFNAINRTYHYYLNTSLINTPIFKDLLGYYPQTLNLSNIQAACKMMIGTHDFSAFRTSICQAKSPIKNMLSITIEQRENILRFEFTANSFLHHMIRNIIGTLIYVGSNKLSVDCFYKKFNNKMRCDMPPTFMPNGLYLSQINYEFILFEQNTSKWIFEL